jgi:EmrB/QacA subfamily drug resistance transporter
MVLCILGKNKTKLLLFVILIGTFLVPVNSTMIAVSLPSIAESLHRSILSVSWMISIYLMIMVVLQPVAGKLGDMYGNRNVFLIGMGLFLISSIGCVYAEQLSWLIVFRGMQAIGGALASPNASAMIRHVTPKEQMAKTFGLFGFIMGIGAAIGPLIGSMLIGIWGWSSIFWFNVPFALTSLVGGFFLLPSVHGERKSKLDIVGSALLAISLAVLVLIVIHIEYMNVWTIGIFIVSSALFARQEIRTSFPLIQFDLFRVRAFSGANVSIFLNNAVMYCTILVMPIFLQKEAEFSLKTVGVLLFVFSISMSLFSWLGGVLSNRLGTQKTIMISFVCLAVSSLTYLFIFNTHSVWLISLLFVLGGAGAGFGTASMQPASLNSVPKQMSGVASGVYMTFRYMGGLLASIFAALFIDYHLLFYTLCGLSIVGVAVAGLMFASVETKRVPMK